jgi:hypothetical protein
MNARDHRSPESLAARLSGNKAHLRAVALRYIQQCREKGATADEICAALKLTHNSIAPRVTELKSRRLITELCDRTGKRIRRKTRQGCAAGVVVALEFSPQNPRPASNLLFGERPPESRYPD